MQDAQTSPSGNAAERKAPEVLAPSGDWSALEAALEAGADAVYLGLTVLNARRRARNFSQDELPRAVETAHARGTRIYLTLNIDLIQRDLGQAARILELARQCRVDAVLVRDPALLALRSSYPELEFHLSTQTCMASSADVSAARQLGAKRVVLARELTLAEIAAASSVPGIQTEVFCQGALCFCVSGRCLLSSWVGGRSGNRGACTSPCRVPWTVEGEPAGTPLSMRDLGTAHRLNQLRDAGVAALKIEGRLKTAQWVRRAVSLYRQALAGNDLAAEQLQEQAQALGAYAGRTLTCGYLDGDRDDLTAVAAGRTAAPTPATDHASDEPTADDETAAAPTSPTYDLDIHVADKGITFRCTLGGNSFEWSIPKTVVHRQHKAVPVSELLARVAPLDYHGYRLGKGTTNHEQFLLVPRAANAVIDRLAAVVRQLDKAPDTETVRIELPQSVRDILEPQTRSAANDLPLGSRPDRARLDADAIGPFLRQVRASGTAEARPDSIIAEGVTAQTLGKVRAACADTPLIVALPPVFFEEDIAAIQRLLAECQGAGVAVEVNTWGGWKLAREAGVRLESGPGLPVLNALAARVLADAGVQCVTLSPEADRQQLEDVTSQCPAPCSLVVFGRPALLVTRVQLPRERFAHKTFTDRRHVRLIPRVERGLWVFRPAEPFDLRTCRNDRVRVHHLVADLVASPNPAAEWLRGPRPANRPFRFNYNRTLA